MSKLLGVLLAGLCATGAMAQTGHDHRDASASVDQHIGATMGDRDRNSFFGARGDRDVRTVANRDRDERNLFGRDRDERRFVLRDAYRHAGWPGHDRGNHYGWYRNGHTVGRDHDEYRHAHFDRDAYARLHHVMRHETRHHRVTAALRRHEEHVASR